MQIKPDYRLNIIQDENFIDEMTEKDKILRENVTSGTIKSFDKTELYYEYYLAENSKASIVIVHGFTEFTCKYHELAWYFINMGYNVFIYDQRGHGLSQRKVSDFQLIHVDKFQDYVEDLNEFINQIVEPVSVNLPLYIYSQSMGGAVAGLYLSKYTGKVSKAILSAPMVCPVAGNMSRKKLRMFLRFQGLVHGWKSKFIYVKNYNPKPNFHFSSDLSENRFRYNLNTRNSNVKYQNSPSTNRWLFEALSVEDKLLSKKVSGKIKAETLIISAEKDTVVKNPQQKKLSEIIPDCRFYEMKGAKHSLYTTTSPMLRKYVEIILEFFS